MFRKITGEWKKIQERNTIPIHCMIYWSTKKDNFPTDVGRRQEENSSEVPSSGMWRWVAEGYHHFRGTWCLQGRETFLLKFRPCPFRAHHLPLAHLQPPFCPLPIFVPLFSHVECWYLPTRLQVPHAWIHTEVGQNNGNTTDTVHISLLIWCWTTFSLQYSHNPSWNGLVQVLNSL
jgi:hypothetical protein